MTDEQAKTETVAEVEPKQATQTQTTEPPAANEEEWDKDRAMALIDKLRGEEKRAKALDKELKAYKDAEAAKAEAEMTELQKAQKRLAEIETELDTAKRAEQKRKVADTFGLPAQLAERLVGETPEELEADAKKLLELVKTKPKINPTDPANPKTGETPEEKRRRLFG